METIYLQLFLHLIIILKGFCLGFLIAYMEPIQALLQLIKIPSKNKWINYIYEGMACHKCLATWIVFGMTLNPFLAAATAVTVYVFEAIMLKLR